MSADPGRAPASPSLGLAEILHLLAKPDNHSTDKQLKAQSVISMLQSVQEKEESLRLAYSGLWQTISTLEKEQQERQAIIDQVKSLVPQQVLPSASSYNPACRQSAKMESAISDQQQHGQAPAGSWSTSELMRKLQGIKAGIQGPEDPKKHLPWTTQGSPSKPTSAYRKETRTVLGLDSVKIPSDAAPKGKISNTPTGSLLHITPISKDGPQSSKQLTQTTACSAYLGSQHASAMAVLAAKKQVHAQGATRTQKMFISPGFRANRAAVSRERGSAGRTTEKTHPRDVTPRLQGSPKPAGEAGNESKAQSRLLGHRLSPKDPARLKVDQIFSRILKNKVDHFDQASVVSHRQEGGKSLSRSPSLSKSQLKGSQRYCFTTDLPGQTLAKAQSFIVLDTSSGGKQIKSVVRNIYSPHRVIVGQGSSQRSILIHQTSASPSRHRVGLPGQGRSSSLASQIDGDKNQAIEVIDATDEDANIYAGIPRISINLSAGKKDIHKIEIESEQPHLVRVRLEPAATTLKRSAAVAGESEPGSDLLWQSEAAHLSRIKVGQHSNSGVSIRSSQLAHLEEGEGSFDVHAQRPTLQSVKSSTQVGRLESVHRPGSFVGKYPANTALHFDRSFKKGQRPESSRAQPNSAKKEPAEEQSIAQDNHQRPTSVSQTRCLHDQQHCESASKDPLSVQIQRVSISASKELQTPFVPPLKVGRLDELVSPALRTASFHSVGVGSNRQSHTHESLLAIENIWNKNRCSREDFTSSVSSSRAHDHQKLGESQLAQLHGVCSARTAGGKENALQRDPSFGRLSAVTVRKDTAPADPCRRLEATQTSLCSKHLSYVSQMSLALPVVQAPLRETPLLNLGNNYPARGAPREPKAALPNHGLASQRTLLKGHFEMIEEISEKAGLSAKSSQNSAAKEARPSIYSSPGAKGSHRPPPAEHLSPTGARTDDVDQIEALQKTINSKFENLAHQLSGIKTVPPEAL